MRAVASDERHSFVLTRLDIWIPSALGVLGVIASVVLAVKIPEPSIFELKVFLTLLALSAGAFAALIPGLLHAKVNAPGLAIRGAGAIGVFLIVFFQPTSTAIKVAESFGIPSSAMVAGSTTREGNAAMQSGDRQTALQLWRQAAAKGDCIASGNVAFALDNGMGTAVDKTAAGQQYKQAAECGNPTAQAVLAGFYAEGSHGLPKDRALAVTYYRLAQKAGVPAAVDGLRALGEPVQP